MAEWLHAGSLLAQERARAQGMRGASLPGDGSKLEWHYRDPDQAGPSVAPLSISSSTCQVLQTVPAPRGGRAQRQAGLGQAAWRMSGRMSAHQRHASHQSQQTDP
jgi:hypothetical protein